MVPLCLVEQLFSFLHRSFLNMDGISLLEDILILLLNLYCHSVVLWLDLLIMLID